MTNQTGHIGYLASVVRLRDDWKTLLEQIALRSASTPPRVLGTPLAPRVREARETAGFVRIDATQSGFRARR